MKLYGFPASPNTWKVRALASYLKIPLEFEFVDLLQGAQHTPAYLAINPTGRTPTLLDGDFTLWESNAILQYLAEKISNSLWPKDARSRVDISRWQFWQLAHWGAEACAPLIFQRLVKKLANLGPPDEAAVAKGTECFNKEAKVLDAHLAKQKYLVGNSLTIADFAVAAPLFHAKSAEIPLGPYGNVRGWFERVSSLPCWSEAAPQMSAAA
ncbi:MAG TPA: glutathione S-transferase family protein [Xanthobacteraceae bacterium]|nr:glutathione S-transferase family protein [Xanthobacteraceae bacterium]